MANVEHEHLVGELDVAHAVLVDEQVDLLDDPLRAPEAVAVHGLLQPQLLLAALNGAWMQQNEHLKGQPSVV